MAIFPLPFGHAEWPVEEPPRRTFAPVDLEPDPAPALPFACVTVSVPVPLKDRIEASAALAGVTPDTWIRRALSRSLDPRLSTR